jgi:hypothetical protein
MAEPGPRVFRSGCEMAKPVSLGRTPWQVRSIVEVGAFYFILTQGPARPHDVEGAKKPAVFLVPKIEVPGAPAMVHLFDIDVYADTRTGFTYSRASKLAKDGTFFTYRAPTDLFPGGHRALKWEVRFA